MTYSYMTRWFTTMGRPYVNYEPGLSYVFCPEAARRSALVSATTSPDLAAVAAIAGGRDQFIDALACFFHTGAPSRLFAVYAEGS